MRALATVALLALAGINAQSTTPSTTSTSTTPSTTTSTSTTTTPAKQTCSSTVAQVDIGAVDPSKDLCNGGRFKVYTPVKSFTTMNAN